MLRLKRKKPKKQRALPRQCSLDERMKTMDYQATLTHNLKVMAEAYKKDFAKALYEDERFTDLVMEKAAEFVETEMPLVDEDHQFDLALMVMETVNVSSY